MSEIVASLLFIIALLFLAIFAIHWLAQSIAPAIVSFATAMSAVDVTIIVALVTGAISILAVILGSIVKSYLSYRYKRMLYLTERRESPYARLVSIVYRVQDLSRKNGEYSEQDMVRDIKEFSQELTLWGSSEAIKKWGKWRIQSQGASSNNPREVLFAMEEILFQLRKDLGQKGKLDQGDLLRFFVNDIDEHIH